MDLGRPTTARAAIIAAVLGTALAYMSDDMLNLAVPSLARDLGATLTDVQWVLNAYYVTLVSFVLVAGSIGDLVGHRRVFMAGLVLFTLGALGCAVSPGVAWLIVGRGMQGIGAAMLLAAGLALVTRLTPAASRTRAVGQFFGLVAAVPALGPFASGALVDLLSWRWLFVVPLVLPVGAFAVTRTLVPETPRATRRRPDLPGAIAAFVALCALSIGLIVGPSGASPALAIGALVAAAVAGSCFAVIESRSDDPMLPLRLFRHRVFIGGNLVWLLGCLSSWGAVFFLAVSLQTTLGLRPIVAGLVLVPIYLLMMVGSPLAARLAQQVGPRWPILGGLAIYTIGLLILGSIGPTSALVPDVLLAIGIFASGMAVFTAPLAAVTLGALGEADQGVASGVNNAMGQLAGLLAIAILPAAAGLAGVSLGSPEFAAGYATAIRVAAAFAGAGLAIAVFTLPAHPQGSDRAG